MLWLSCPLCNTYKGDFFPTAADIQHGRRILHPLRDVVSLHFREDERTGCLEPLTATGQFHLFQLRLNRPQLVEHRLARRLRQLLSEAHQLLRHENEDLRLRVLWLESYLRELHRRRAEEAGQEGAESPI